MEIRPSASVSLVRAMPQGVETSRRLDRFFVNRNNLMVTPGGQAGVATRKHGLLRQTTNNPPMEVIYPVQDAHALRRMVTESRGSHSIIKFFAYPTERESRKGPTFAAPFEQPAVNDFVSSYPKATDITDSD